MAKERADEFWTGEGEAPKAPETRRKPGARQPEPKTGTTRSRPRTRPAPRKINLEGEKMRDGLAQLVLTVVELLREVMEKQAIRRMEHGSLTEEQIEALGNNFMRLKEEIERLKDHFRLEDEDLNLNLGPLVVREDGTDKASAVELLDRLLGKGVVVRGDVVISVAEVDLISLNLGLLLASIDKAKELYGRDIRTAELEGEVQMLREENRRLKNLSPP